LKPKEYLQQVQKLDVMINQKIAEKSELGKFDGISGIDYSGDKVQSSSNGDAPFTKIVERIIDIEKEIDDMIDQYVNLKHQIINEIQSLPNVTYIDVLYKKYIEYKRLEVIAVEMNYSYQYVRVMHGYALQEFEKAVLKVSTQ
jgi:hypothetical protein